MILNMATQDDINTIKNSLGFTVQNLIPYPYYEGNHTDNGITWTVNEEDGTVTANGTATATSNFFVIYLRGNFTIANGTYTVSGCPLGGSKNTYRSFPYKIVDGNAVMVGGYEFGNGLTFTVEENIGFGMTLQILSGVTANNLTFKPMLVKGDTVKPYTPYAKSVEERLGGCWIDFTDAEGNATDEPYIHWLAEVTE